MINLLPTQAKRKLTKEYQLRFLVLFLWGVFALEILTAAFFMPTYYTLGASTANLSRELEQQKKFPPIGGADTERRLSAIESEVALLKLGSTTLDVAPSVLLDMILTAKPRGIEFNSLSYERAVDGARVALSGVAETRENLIEFQNNLRQNPKVGSIKYGDSFITKKTDINFAVTISFK
jgi:Tfp pilus assembly protein PilN